MPNWEGIEDAATMLPRIWLTRSKDGDVWKPLRKIDCKALNESRGENVCAYNSISFFPQTIEHKLIILGHIMRRGRGTNRGR